MPKTIDEMIAEYGIEAAKIYAKHECEELRKQSLPTGAPIISIERYGYDQNWHLEHFDDFGIIIEIQYCPFCGLELSA